MSKAKFDDDVERIMNEVDNFDLDDIGEEGVDDIDVDDLLKGMKLEHPEPANPFQDHYDPLNLHDSPTFIQEQKPKLDSTKHPLKVIEEHETDISSKLGGQANLDSKFLVLNYEKNNDKKLPNVTYRTLESITDYCFPEEANAISAYDAEAWGNPKCIAVYPDKYIAVGTSRAQILVFHYGETTPRRLGSTKEQEYGAVTAIDLSMREDCLISGYESGHIVLWKVDRNELQRVIPPSDRSPVISLRFWREGRSNVISSTAKGVVHLHTFVYSFFQWSTDKKVLIDAAAAAEKRAKSNEIDPLAHLPDGFFDIQILRRELTRHHSLSRYTVAALCSMKMVLIITLEPVVGSVFKYVRPEGIHDLIVPSISWGKGALPEQDGNRHPILAMSWGREVFLLQCQNVEDAEAKGIRFMGIYESKYDIFHIDWMSESNLLVYDYSREFKILYTEMFNTIAAAKFTDSKFDYDRAIISSQPLDPDISFQIYSLEKNARNSRPILYYTNTVITNQFHRRVFILGYKRMYIGRHFEWKEHIQDFVNQKEWLPAFALFVSFAQGKNKTFAGLPIKSQERKDVIKEYGAEVVSNYIAAVRDENGPPELTTIIKVWKTVVLIVIDLLVSIENFDYLFKDIKRMFENFGIQDLFMDSLETFIFRNRIKYVPNEPFREMVKYYTEKERISVLQYLMVNIEMRGIDIDYAINLCMEYNLLTALFYFCSHRENSQGGADFLTPIVRALTLCQKNITDKNAENNELGIKFLWFVSMTINGKMFPTGTIPNDIWEDKVRGVLVLIFEEINLELMLRIQPYVSFEIFRNLYEPKLTTLISSYDSSSIKLLDDTVENRTSNTSSAEQKQALKLFSDFLYSRIQAQMLTLIYCHCKKKGGEKKVYKNLLYYFLADLTINLAYDLPEQVIQETLFFILENDRDVPKWEVKENKKLSNEEDDEEIDPNMELRNTLLLGLLKKLEGKLNNADFEKVQKVIDQSQFIDVKAYLLGLKKDYQRCFDLYFDQSSDSQKMKVFDWLDNLSQSLKQNELKPLKSVVMTHFRELVALSNEKTRKVIQNLGEMFDIQAVAALAGSPRLQLNYVQGLLLQREIGIQIPDDILILHIKLLCQLHPKQVIEEVKKTTYPLDESLKIVKEYGLNNVAAFFLERAGNLHEALDITLDLFTKSTEKKLKKIEEHGLFNEEGLTKKLNNVKEICNKNSKLGDPDTEKLWFKVLDRVLKNYFAYVMNNYKVQSALKKDSNSLKDDSLRRFGRTYTEYVSVLFDDISRHIEVESIAKKLSEYNKMTLRELGGPIVTMLEAYGTEEWIVKETDRLVLDNMFNGLTDLYSIACKGFGSDIIDIDSDLVDKMAVFECRHSFPRNYIQTSHCLVCKEDDLTQAKAIVLKKGKQAQKAMSALIKEPTSASSMSAISARESQDSHSDLVARNEALNEVGSAAAIPSSAAQMTRDDWKEKYLRKLTIIDLSEQESVIDWDEKIVQKRSFG